MGDLGGPYDAIVIGSGISGLSSANILAMRGQRVLLLEQHSRFGGYLQSFSVRGTRFESGCHYVGALGPGQVFDRYLRYLGVRDDIIADPMDPEGFDVLIYPTWRFSIPVGYDRFEDRLGQQYPVERPAIARFLAALRAEVAQFPMYTLEPSANPRARSANPTQTVADALHTAGVSHPEVIEVLTAYRGLYLVPPEEAPFGMHAFAFDSFIRGAYTIRGGGNALAKALVAALRRRGGVALRNTDVARVHVEDGCVRGVETAAGAYEEAPVVIAAIDPKAAVSLLPRESVRGIYRNRINGLRSGIGGLSAYLRVDADLSRFAGANYWLRPRANGDSVFRDDVLEAGDPSPLFVSVPSAREPGWKGPQAVIGVSGMSLDAFARWEASATGARGDGYATFKQEIGDRMLSAMRTLIPELETHLVSADYSTPLTHQDYTRNSGGAIYGVHHSVAQAGERGVGWRTRVKGFLLTGHSVLYPGLIGATISAFYTCGELVGLESLHGELCRV